MTAQKVKEMTPERFHSQIKFGEENECWEWQGSTDGGYGLYWETKKEHGRSKKFRAHRFLYQAIYGPLKSHQLVCHGCDNRKCCNPSHYFIGDTSANITDMWGKGRGTTPVRSGEKNGWSKFTEDQIREIRKRIEAGESNASIARSFNVWKSTIRSINVGKTWARVV